MPLIDMDFIQEMANRIKATIPGSEVYLFGSYAWGRPGSESDVDFAVIVPDGSDTRELCTIARRATGHGEIPIDVIVMEASRFDSLKFVLGSLTAEIAREGRRLC